MGHVWTNFEHPPSWYCSDLLRQWFIFGVISSTHLPDIPDIVKKVTFGVTGTKDGSFFICRRRWLVVKTVSLGPKMGRFLLAAGDG